MVDWTAVLQAVYKLLSWRLLRLAGCTECSFHPSFTRVVHLSSLFQVLFCSLFQQQRCQLWFLFLCVGFIEFLYLIQCFITDQCFITVLSWQLNNCLTTFFLLTVDPWGLLGVKKLWKAAHNLCLLDLACSVPAPFIYRSVSARLCTVRKSFWS